MKKKSFYIFMFILFILTLKFEILNNFIVFFLCLIYFKKFSFPTFAIYSFIILILILIPFYIFYVNWEYIKYILYVFRLLIVLSIFWKLFNVTIITVYSRYAIDAIFIVHVFAIFICYLFPSVNDIFRGIFSYSTGSSFRISGFIQGYEFVSYFVLVYLAYSFEIAERRVDLRLILKLIFGGVAILLSGRFGLIPLGLFLIFVFIRGFDILKFSLLLALIVFLLPLFSEQMANVKNTFGLVTEMTKGIDGIDLNQFNEKQLDGQYNLSPLTFYYEFIRPFENWGSHLFPGSLEYVDSGPSFLALNFGFVLTFILYLFYFHTIGVSSGRSIPWHIVLLVLLVDLKFRSLYTLFPMIWLLINHYSFIIINQKK